MVGAMGEVSEILQERAIHRLPGSSQWVRGVANVRGSAIADHRFESVFSFYSQHSPQASAASWY